MPRVVALVKHSAVSISASGMLAAPTTLAKLAKSRSSRGSSAFNCFSMSSSRYCSLTGKATVIPRAFVFQ